MGVDDSDGDKFKITHHGTDVGGADHFTMDGSGYVGIGDSSPAMKLHVKHNTTSYVAKVHNEGGADDSHGMLVEVDTSNTAANIFRASSPGGSFIVKSGGSTSMGKIHSSGQDGGSFFGADSGGSSNPGYPFGFVSSMSAAAGTPTIRFTGSLSEGHTACFIVTTGTRSNASAVVSVAIVTFARGYNQNVSATLTTLSGNTMTGTNNCSGATVKFIAAGGGSAGGSGVPTQASCMQIGGHPSHGVVVETGLGLTNA
jgi:hypothetical protein